jgi:DNA-binding transcriptional regulator YhcF (GntR family)
MNNPAVTTGVDAGQSELWEELAVKNQWFHVLRAAILDNKIAEMGMTAWAVYCVIKAYTNMKSGDSWPSQSTIAGHLGVSVDTVARATEKLITLDMVKREKRGRSSVYRLIESIPLARKSDNIRVADAKQQYIPLGFESFIDQLKLYAKDGQLPQGANFQVTFNITNVVQGDNSTVNISNVTLSDPEQITRTHAVNSAIDVIAKRLTNRTKALRTL